MIIQIGTNLIFGGNSPYQIEPGISGLDSASIRTGDGLYASADGGFISAQLYGQRTITFTGFFVPTDCDNYETLRRNLLTGLTIRTLYPISITTFDDAKYYTSGYLVDIKSEVSGPRANEFQITIQCPDPTIYEADENNPLAPKWTQVTLNGESHNTVTVGGTANVYPIITALPSSTQSQMQFSNHTIGEALWLMGITGTTETITVDMERRTVMRGSDSIANLRTLASRWWWLEPGVNDVGYWTNYVSGQTATMRYKTGYQGI